MADTLQNINIPKNTWVNLYSASGINAGTRIIVQNVGQHEIRLVSKATEPTSLDGYTLARPYEEKINDRNDSGAWAWSSQDCFVNVRIAR